VWCSFTKHWVVAGNPDQIARFAPRDESLHQMAHLIRKDNMALSRRETTRRQAIAAALVGSYPLSLRAAQPTVQEKANIQVVKDFCEAWPAHDVGKIMSYFADNCAYRPLETMETAKGRDAVEKEIKRFVNNVQRFEIRETWARGPMVINQRIDHFKDFQIKAWHGTGVFFLKGGRIVERLDYTTFTDPISTTGARQ
jgi:limonene-1,2-epoxide hydrolase